MSKVPQHLNSLHGLRPFWNTNKKRDEYSVALRKIILLINSYEFWEPFLKTVKTVKLSKQSHPPNSLFGLKGLLLITVN